MGYQQVNAGLKPSNWTITSNNGTNVVATNDITKEAFSGTLVAFNAKLAAALAVDDAVSAETDTNAAVKFVVGAAAPSNGDGRPDGTIYIQTV